MEYEWLSSTAPIAKWLVRSPRVQKVLGLVPGAVSYLDFKPVLSATQWTEEGKAMCSKPPVEACHFSVVHIVWCSEGPCEPGIN